MGRARRSGDTGVLDLRFREGKLAVVESVNRAGDHAAAKRIIDTTKTLTPEGAADPRSICGGWRSDKCSRLWNVRGGVQISDINKAAD